MSNLIYLVDYVALANSRSDQGLGWIPNFALNMHDRRWSLARAQKGHVIPGNVISM